ncbi:alpha/beta hydrolase [Polyangium aurulentum]|uniref:alpha/beta hydrolase n=1 Tax=Polyangium aurulentum TaxID=2567896 RepID=UPI0010AE68AA|nr:alpha/beta family hydrolase [Polyangium aurulentum]UQA58977.1 hypothetical protein E8A73_000180 [Polyangium aurulentum]
MTSLFLSGPAGRLEAEIKRSPGATTAAVVCHPHPQYGGTLYNKIVYRAARSIHGAGITALRFNFRGVEGSEGHFDGGRGEVDDARAALDFLASEHDRLIVAGYSFGAWVGLRAGIADPRVKALIGIGLPIDVFDFSFLRDARVPLLIVHGDRDGWGEADKVRALSSELPGPVSLELIQGADHFFEGHHLETMMGKISDFLAH